MGAVALCFAEVGSRFTQTGGPYLYARVAFGPAIGFIVGWITWVTRPLTIAAMLQKWKKWKGKFKVRT